MMLAYFSQNNNDSQAVTLVNTWQAAQPHSISARIQQVMDMVQERRIEDAVALTRKLFDQYPDVPDVVRTLVDLLTGTRQQQQLIDTLETERNRHPNNIVVVGVLVDQYLRQNKASDASRVLDAARIAVANDAEQLYDVASLYHRANQGDTSEQVLEEVLKIDPTNPQAGNDLGYFWADAGKNLERAESLIRMAVDAEPYNPSYLDSLGWVLYKRSKFPEAVKLLEQASAPLERADPVVLDHLGDALYRLNRNNDARGRWQQALQGIEQEKAARQQVQQQLRDDLVKLQLQLQAKLRQADAGQPVNVAPIVESAPPPQGQTQANKE
jgi:Flp pilus assembly protein TadD